MIALLSLGLSEKYGKATKLKKSFYSFSVRVAFHSQRTNAIHTEASNAIRYIALNCSCQRAQREPMSLENRGNLQFLQICMRFEEAPRILLFLMKPTR